MDYIIYTERLNYLLHQIERGRVSSPEEVAIKYDCSERTVRRMINHLRASGYSIKYCRRRLRYYIAE
jgi:biotin operon repressor